jgi:hypothetical protein
MANGIEVHHYVHFDNETDIKKLLTKLTKNGELIMATLADVQAALSLVALAATQEKAEVNTALAALNTTILSLQAQLANGTQVTATDLDTIVGTITGIAAQVADITVPAVAPVVEAPVVDAPVADVVVDAPVADVVVDVPVADVVVDAPVADVVVDAPVV